MQRILNSSANLRLPGSFVKALLFCVFSLAFIITPYWTLPSTMSLRIAALLVTALLGAAWSVLSGGEVRARIQAKGLAFFAVLVVVMLALNFRQLTSGIPWRGDEDFHINKTLDFMGIFLQVRGWVYAAALAYAIFLLLAWRKPRWAAAPGALVTLGAGLFFLTSNPFAGEANHFLLRYPFFSYWFAVIAPSAGKAIADPYHEALYRVLPFLFACAVAWLYQRHIPSFHPALALLWSVSAATIPLVLYYASIFYLEMPAVFLMLVVCFSIKDLLGLDAARLKSHPAWYSLILIGFVKETTLPFLLSFLLCRWIVQVLQGRPGTPFTQVSNPRDPPRRPSWIGEAAVAFSVLLPVALYLVFRGVFWAGRTFGMEWGNLFQFQAYAALLRSFFDQFGAFALFFLAGCVLLFKKKEAATLAFLLIAFAAAPLFHLVDSWVFAGYSRFNLFLLPLVLAGAAVFFRWLFVRKRAAAVGVAVIAVAASLIISPIHLDGSKEPYWDSYLVDTSEHYYPYREAISWLKTAFPDTRVLVAGNPTSYNIRFYARKYEWRYWRVMRREPRELADSAALSSALAEAEESSIPVVMFHVLGGSAPEAAPSSGYRLEKIIQNSAHMLTIYRRAP